MREYLKAIGFSDLNSRKKIDELINEIKKNPSRKNWFQIDEEEAIFIYEKDFAEAVGIAVIEVMDRDGYRVTDHFYPYVRGANYLYHEDLEFEHYTDKEGYAGICDENNIGIPLIFHVNNPVDYLKIVYGKFHDKINSITLSGMSKKGMIILPVEKDEFQEREERKGNELRNEMIDAAKAGDIEAMEQLKAGKAIQRTGWGNAKIQAVQLENGQYQIFASGDLTPEMLVLLSGDYETKTEETE